MKGQPTQCGAGPFEGRAGGEQGGVFNVGDHQRYIASLNTENYVAMQADMSSGVKAAIEKAVVVTLRGDKAAGKLLGIQFGKSVGK